MRATGQNTADNQGDIAGITGYQSPETITLDIGGINETDIDVVTKPMLQSINSNIRLAVQQLQILIMRPRNSMG